jgi:GNAT superfamily N-acetyltransferase
VLPTKRLGGGLLLRAAQPADAEELAEFNGQMHADAVVSAQAIADWTLDLMQAGHPTFDADRDVTVVEDTTSGRIVSALMLIPQVWSYAGVEMLVGQPELIATHPDYRRRGLVRHQFAAIHEHSDPVHLWQYISGIPWYYRQFGYSYALDFVPSALWWFKENEPPGPASFALRPATDADVEFLADVEAGAQRRALLTAVRGREGWALELRRRPGALPACEVHVLEQAGTSIGYVVNNRARRNEHVIVLAFELAPGRPWLEPTAAVLAALRDRARDDPARPKAIRFVLAAEHPALRCMSKRISRSARSSYAFYVRVPDVVRLLERIRPVLDGRLATSPAAGHTGRLALDFYTYGLSLSLVDGRIASIERTESSPDDADVAMPVEAFLHVAFGNRSLADVDRDVADCQVESDAGALLMDVLFPPMALGPWEMG